MKVRRRGAFVGEFVFIVGKTGIGGGVTQLTIDLAHDMGGRLGMSGLIAVHCEVVGEAANAAERHQRPQRRFTLKIDGRVLQTGIDIGNHLGELPNPFDLRPIDRGDFRGDLLGRLGQDQLAVDPKLGLGELPFDEFLIRSVQLSRAITGGAEKHVRIGEFEMLAVELAFSIGRRNF